MADTAQMAHLVARRIFRAYHTRIMAELFYFTGDDQRHDHDFLEIAVVLSGRGVHSSIHGDFPIQIGDVFVLRPGAWHVYHDCQELVLYNCCFSLELLQRELAWIREDPLLSYLIWTGPMLADRRGIMSFKIHSDVVERCRQILDALSRSTASDSEYNRGDQIGHLLLYLAELARHLGPEHRPIAEQMPGIHRAVGEGMRLLEEDAAHPWTLEELARRLHVAPSYLVRLFKASTGLPPMNYLTRLRTERAAALLLRTDWPVADIGREVGWDDANYFARRFKAAFGITATAYRRRFLRHGRPRRAASSPLQGEADHMLPPAPSNH
jgi:AraC family transcriptional regulator, L-rhamnose operon transcriptional activator RhaR